MEEGLSVHANKAQLNMSLREEDGMLGVVRQQGRRRPAYQRD